MIQTYPPETKLSPGSKRDEATAVNTATTNRNYGS